MRISELAVTSGVAVHTIKYYLRERLLTAGERSSANQASYDDGHLKRLRLIRALLDTGGLPVATAREVLAAIDDPALPLTWIFGVAQHAISDAGLYAPITEATPGLDKVDTFIERSGWHVSPENPGRFGAARVLDSYESAGHPELAEIWDGYAEGSELIAQADLATVGRNADVESMSETVVVGTVLGDAMLSSLRRMAQEHVSTRVFPGPPEERSASS
jgi:DNA-binding transcriptional MerR regulator